MNKPEVQHLTILGDRLAGKTKLLVDVAVDEAGRQGRKVLFFCTNREQDAWTLKLIEARAAELLGAEQITRTFVSTGQERIVFASGGEVFFRITNRENLDDIDTHIIDDVAGGDSWVGASRIYRAYIR